MIQEFQQLLPPTTEPDYVHFPYSGEAYKEQAERAALEEEAAPRTRECLEQFLHSGLWPKSEPSAAFFAEQRLKFAHRFAAALATPALQPEGTAYPVPRPSSGLRDTIRWLALRFGTRKLVKAFIPRPSV